MKTYMQPQILIEHLASSYAVCQTISSPESIIPGFADPGGGDGPH